MAYYFLQRETYRFPPIQENQQSMWLCEQVSNSTSIQSGRLLKNIMHDNDAHLMRAHCSNFIALNLEQHAQHVRILFSKCKINKNQTVRIKALTSHTLPKGEREREWTNAHKNEDNVREHNPLCPHLVSEQNTRWLQQETIQMYVSNPSINRFKIRYAEFQPYVFILHHGGRWRKLNFKALQCALRLK